jgi:murein L,D-transpeptidase YcbB/YkuD
MMGDLKETVVVDSTLYDSLLVEAVKSFQSRHGLDIDGRLGPKTVAAMNVPVSERIDQIRLNLERWRWLPQNFGDKYIIVNIANFELDVYENNESVMDMRIIAGKTYRRTPVFSDQITYIVFSPYWNIPGNIAAKDILPMVGKDIEYLDRMKIKVFSGYGSDLKEIDPAEIDWQNSADFNKKYWLRQEPGRSNLLGGAKFMFPNRFNVYLHDTPARELFGKTSRDFSSGCIRIEKPEELAIYLLKNEPKWTPEKIREAMKKGTEQTALLSSPVPVYILYWTAWIGDNGLINFSDDIYKRDRALLKALDEKPDSR